MVNQLNGKDGLTRFLWDRFWRSEKGMKGSLATTFPSKMDEKVERRAVNTRPIANIDFILNMDRSLFVACNTH